MKKKTIAFSIEHFDPLGGGAEAYSIDLAKMLIAKGWEVHFIGESWTNEPKEAIFHLIQIPGWLPAGFKMLWFAFAHRKIAQKINADVTLGFGNTIWMNVYQSHGGVHWVSTDKKSYSVSNGLRFFKRVFSWLSFKQWVRHWIEKAPIRLVPRPEIIAISPMVRDDFVRYYKIPREKIHLILNGINLEKYTSELKNQYKASFRDTHQIPAEDVVFLFASFDLRKKGFYVLLEAAAILQKKDEYRFKIVVAGGMPDQRCFQLMEKYKLTDKVSFLGKVAPMEQLYGASDVFIMPTYYDSCSLVVQEAMASGLPVVTTTAAGVAGSIQSGKDGFVIPHPPAANVLAEKMIILMDASMRENMGSEARKTSVEYNVQKNHQAMVEIFDEVAARKEKPE